MMINKVLSNLIQNLACLVKLGILLFLYTATVQADQATFMWDAVTESTLAGYRLHYGQGSRNYQSSIDVKLKTSYTVSTLPDGTYYFAVTAYDANGNESDFSNEVSKTFCTNCNPNGSLPSPWVHMDIGNVGLVGNASYKNGTFTLSGSGADIWGTADAFHFVYQPLTGNGTIIARVVSTTNTDPYAKVGVMIRENLDYNARHAMVVVTSEHGVEFDHRWSLGGGSYYTSGAQVQTPYWVKLVRIDNRFRAYQSVDGITWARIGRSITINMASSVYIGLAVTSHNNDTLNTATLDNVRVTSN